MNEESVSGVWYGRWESDDIWVSPNRFIAVLEETAGAIHGTVAEPDDMGPVPLNAILRGAREGNLIHWVKQYDGAGRLAHAVDYTGKVNPAATRIKGTWRFSHYSGTFVMERERFRAEQLATETALEAPVG